MAGMKSLICCARWLLAGVVLALPAAPALALEPVPEPALESTIASPVATAPAQLVDAAPDADADSQWLSVRLAGRKIGHSRIDRMIGPERVSTRYTMEFELARDGIAMLMVLDEMHEEGIDGQPLAFSSRNLISGLDMRVQGQRQDDGRFAVRSGAAGQLRETTLDWPRGALLAWGLEQRLRELGTVAGTQTRLKSFQPLLQDAGELHYQVVGTGPVDLPGGRIELVETEQNLHMHGAIMTSRVWLDADMTMRRMTMDVLGQTLELIDCDRACALAPNQPAEILTHVLLQPPRPLSRTELAQPLALDLHSPVPLAAWPGLDGQQLQRLDGERYRLLTRQPEGDASLAPPAPDDLVATDWLNYEAEPVQALLTELAAPADADAGARMAGLERLVNRHIDNKSLRIGYASAADAAQLREGDCTEHAVLLAALARASGIPARVVTGFAWSSQFGGQASFVPHAWVAAWTGEQWQAFDAALPGRHQLRLAMHADDGDPWRFYDGLDAIGQLRIEAIEVIAPPAN